MALGITVGETGNYTVLVYDQDGCAGISNPISIEVYEPEVPTITVDGDLKLCDGESVTLICSAAPGYAWSTGATDQSIQISEAGTYSVSIDGECAEPTASEDIVVEVYDVPGTPTVEDTEIPAPASTTLEFTGSELHWYDSETAETPVFVGNSYTTDVLTETTTFWVEDVLNHGLETAMGGSSAQSDGQYHNNSNYWLRFDAYEDLVIESVKVFANGTEDRTVAAIDAAGNILDQITVTIPDGEHRGTRAHRSRRHGPRSRSPRQPPTVARWTGQQPGLPLRTRGSGDHHLQQREQPQQRHQLLLLLLRLDREHPRHRLCLRPRARDGHRDHHRRRRPDGA